VENAFFRGTTQKNTPGQFNPFDTRRRDIDSSHARTRSPRTYHPPPISAFDSLCERFEKLHLRRYSYAATDCRGFCRKNTRIGLIKRAHETIGDIGRLASPWRPYLNNDQVRLSQPKPDRLSLLAGSRSRLSRKVETVRARNHLPAKTVIHPPDIVHIALGPMRDAEN